jgi:asparagine synthetase B (glutamine-hydrolysing)
MFAQADADGMTALLDGQGGDELFANAPYLIADRLRRGRLLSALGLLRRFPRSGPLPLWVVRYLWRVYGIGGALPYALHQRARRRGDLRRHYSDWVPQEAVERLFAEDRRYEWKRRSNVPLWWANLVYATTTFREASGTTEHMAMRAPDLTVESRPPLFDIDLIEFVLRLPPELNFRHLDRSLVRESLAGVLPDAVRLCRQKSHLGRYFHEGLSGPDLVAIQALLLDPRARVRSYVDTDRMTELARRPIPVRSPGWLAWASGVWLLATTELWLHSLEDPGFPDRFADRYELSALAYDVIDP